MTNNSNQYHVIGLMSGTSLDGVDIAFCKFLFHENNWSFEIVYAETIPYSIYWKNILSDLENSDALSFLQANVDYGSYLGKLVVDFLNNNNFKVDFVSSHGHTIFHQPEKKLTVQIGSASALAAVCKLPVVSDFRTLDIALGGQGSPLVPIGDKLLFSEYNFCLNLGGFSNISYEVNMERIAFDICPVNIVMNAVCKPLGLEFDDHGALARNGNINDDLLKELNHLEFYNLPSNKPKSLGKEWVIKYINPLLVKYNLCESDILRTFCEHVAIQTAHVLNNKPSGNLLVTGGGAYNTFLIEALSRNVSHKLIIPDKNIIEFKEALIFAFLGVLRVRNEINCLKSVTGAQFNNIGGVVTIIN